MNKQAIAEEDRLNFAVIESAIKTAYNYTAGYREALISQWKQDLEAELRAKIAAEIRAEQTDVNWPEIFRNGLLQAALIAEGKA